MIASIALVWPSYRPLECLGCPQSSTSVLAGSLFADCCMFERQVRGKATDEFDSTLETAPLAVGFVSDAAESLGNSFAFRTFRGKLCVCTFRNWHGVAVCRHSHYQTLDPPRFSKGSVYESAGLLHQFFSLGAGAIKRKPRLCGDKPQSRGDRIDVAMTFVGLGHGRLNVVNVDALAAKCGANLTGLWPTTRAFRQTTSSACSTGWRVFPSYSES